VAVSHDIVSLQYVKKQGRLRLEVRGHKREECSWTRSKSIVSS